MRSQNSGRKGRVFAIAICFVAVIVVAVIAVQYLFFGEVEFQDPLVERCVRITLGKETDETITKKECAKIEQLLIDCDLDITCSRSSLDLGTESANYIDLCDLQYLTGLKELVIDNNMYRDMLVNMDAIGYCTKLESLTMRYNPITPVYYGTVPMGYKYLADIVEKLPNLKDLNLGYVVAKEHCELIAGKNDELRVEDDFGEQLSILSNRSSGCMQRQETVEGYQNGWSYGYDKEERHPDTMYFTVGTQEELTSFLESLPKDTEDICIQYTGDDCIDMEPIAEFSELKTLTIMKKINVFFAPEDKMVEVKNLEALAENKELFALNLSGIKSDFEAIGLLTQLKELSMCACCFDELDFLDSLSEIRELSLVGNINSDVEEYFEEQGEKMKNLRFLMLDLGEPSEYDGIQNIPNLETLTLLIRANPTTLEYIAQCPKLKYLSIVTMEDEVDISELKQLKTLVYFSDGNMNRVESLDGVEEILKLPNLVSLSLPILEDAEDNQRDINEWIDVALDSQKLSCMIPSVEHLIDMAHWRWKGEDDTHDWIDLDKLYENGIVCGCYDAFLIYRPDLYETIDDVAEDFEEQ